MMHGFAFTSATRGGKRACVSPGEEMSQVAQPVDHPPVDVEEPHVAGAVACNRTHPVAT